MDIIRLDHLVLTVTDIERTLSFYESVPINSFYFRDPDGNLIEVCSYEEADRLTP